MSESSERLHSRAEPLFEVDLGENGGRLAPTHPDELRRWLDTEKAQWGWNFDRTRQSALSPVIADALRQLNQIEKRLQEFEHKHSEDRGRRHLLDHIQEETLKSS